MCFALGFPARLKVSETKIALKHKSEMNWRVIECYFWVARPTSRETEKEFGFTRPKVREIENELGSMRPKVRETESELGSVSLKIDLSPGVMNHTGSKSAVSFFNKPLCCSSGIGDTLAELRAV